MFYYNGTVGLWSVLSHLGDLLKNEASIYQSHRLERVVPTYVPLELGHVVLWLPYFVQVGVVLLFTATP